MLTLSGKRFLINPIPTFNSNEYETMIFPGDWTKPKNRKVLAVYAAGATHYTKLLLEDVFDVDTVNMAYDAYNVMVSPMTTLAKQMMNGQTNAKYTALVEAIHRRDVDMYLRGITDIDIAVGRSQEELEASVKIFFIATLSYSPLCIVVKVHGFKPKRVKGDSSDNDDSSSVTSVNDAPVKFTSKYNATQFVHTQTVIPRYAVKKKVSNLLYGRSTQQ
jgi:hypothetical protein